IVAQISGKVAQGYKISTILCEPQTILIKGPAKTIDRVSEILTEQVDVSDIKSGLVQNVNLHVPADAGYVVENKPVSITITLQQIYKNQNFQKVRINPPAMKPGYEVELEKEFLDIIVNAPLNKLGELDSSSISLDSKLPAGDLDTGSVLLDLSISGATVPVEIKPSQVKGYIKIK
ncbi:MAG TPA: YbbR-like domain-containing protein, partial [Candidatus Wallbacteria bacterium]|nr:YbbR-like domain-containing protein [Candidatus Wallbacteria bacterium]